MKLTFPDKTAADKRNGEIHAALKLASPLYKASCDLYDQFNGAKGGTARWDTPKQDVDKDGKVVGTDWFITVDERQRKVLTKAETDTIVEWAVQIDSVKEMEL